MKNWKPSPLLVVALFDVLATEEALVMARSVSGALRSRSVQSQAICQPSFSWMDNQEDQSPCLAFGYVAAACQENDFTVEALNGTDSHYNPPTSDTANVCFCSWAAYNLLQACAACQGADAIFNYAPYELSCTNLQSDPNPYPTNIPISNLSSIPFWATTNPTTWTGQSFDTTAAQQLAQQGKPDLTQANRATYLSTSTTSTTSSPTQTPSTPPSQTQTSSSSGGGTNIGAIVGGVVGGVAGLALLGFILFFLLCRHRRPSERIRSVNASSKKSIGSRFRSKPLSQNSSVDLQLKDNANDDSLMEGGAGHVQGAQMSEYGSVHPFVPPSAFPQQQGDISGAPSAYGGGHAHTLSNQSTASFTNTYAQSFSYASDADNATPFIPMTVTHARSESDPNTVTSSDQSNLGPAISPTTRQLFTVANMGGPVVSTPPRRRHNPPAYTPVSSPDESMLQGPILETPPGHRNQPSDELSGLAQVSHTDLGSSSFRADTPGDVTSNIDTLVGDAGHSALTGSPSASDAPLKPRPAPVLVPQNADPDTESDSHHGFPADRKTG